MKSRLFSFLLIALSTVSAAGLATNTLILANVVSSLSAEPTTEELPGEDQDIETDGQDEGITVENTGVEEPLDEGTYVSFEGEDDAEDWDGGWSGEDDWIGEDADEFPDNVDWSGDDIDGDYIDITDEEPYDDTVEKPYEEPEPQEEEKEPYATDDMISDETGEEPLIKTEVDAVENDTPNGVIGDDNAAADLPDQPAGDSMVNEDTGSTVQDGVSDADPSNQAGGADEPDGEDLFGIQVADGNLNTPQDGTDTENEAEDIPDQPHAGNIDNEDDIDQAGQSELESGTYTDVSNHPVVTDDVPGENPHSDTKEDNGSPDSLNEESGSDTAAGDDKKHGAENLDSKKILTILSDSAKCETGGFSVQDDRFVIRVDSAEEQYVVFGLEELLKGLNNLSFTMQKEGELPDGMVEVMVYVNKTSDGAPDYSYHIDSTAGPEIVSLNIEGVSFVSIRIINHSEQVVQIAFTDPAVS